jgi:hypothetical protein
MENPVGLIFIFVGLFSMAGGIFNWEWFMTNRRARLFVKIFGRSGARIFFGILGLGFIIFGFASAFGMV